MDYSLVTTYKTNKVCYLILPEGVSKDLNVDLQELAERFSLTFVMIEGVDWNDDLTPWPASGVFKKQSLLADKLRFSWRNCATKSCRKQKVNWV